MNYYPPFSDSPAAKVRRDNRRIDRLERRVDGSGAIRFDFDNEGGWLQVNTNLGGATAVFADQTITNAGIGLTTQDGSILALGTNGGGDVYVDSSNSLFLSSGGGTGTQAYLTLDGTGGFNGAGDVVNFDGSTQILLSSVGSVVLQAFTGSTGITTIQNKVTDGNFFAVSDFLSPATLHFYVGSTGIFMPHLPTVAPSAGSKQLWNSGGTVKIA